MSRVIITTPNAEADIDRTMLWLTRNYSHRTASRWYGAILRAIRSLQADADCHPEADEAFAINLNLRELLVKRYRGVVYRVLYTINDDTVTIHRVRNAAQDSLTEDDF